MHVKSCSKPRLTLQIYRKLGTQQFNKNYNKLRAHRRAASFPSSRVSLWERGFHKTKLVLSANIERTVRGHATNPAKFSRTTPSELFSESGSWLPLSYGRRPMCSPTCEKILQKPVRLPASIQVDGPMDRAETTLGKTSEMVTVASPDDTCFPYPAQSHFHRRRSVYTRCRTRPTNIFLGKILSPGIQRPTSDVIMRFQQDCEPELRFK